jgi:hypothetical protein
MMSTALLMAGLPPTGLPGLDLGIAIAAATMVAMLSVLAVVVAAELRTAKRPEQSSATPVRSSVVALATFSRPKAA